MTNYIGRTFTHHGIGKAQNQTATVVATGLPFLPEPPTTSLGELNDHDWSILTSRWSRGIDWNVQKVGKRHWEITGRLGRGFPPFKTKTAAYDAGSTLVLMEAQRRSWVRLKAEGKIA